MNFFQAPAAYYRSAALVPDDLGGYVALLINADAAAAGIPNRAFFDSSSYGNVVTPYLDLSTTNAATSQSSFGPFSPTDGTYSPAVHGGSITCSANTDNLRIPAPAALGAGDFTVECWIWLPATLSGSTKGLFTLSNAANQDLANLGFSMNLTINRTMQYYVQTNKGTGTGVIPVQQWTHIAWVKSGIYMTYYINGVQDLQMATAAYGFNGSNPVNFSQGVYYINKGTANAVGMTMSLSEVRLSNVARYTSNFTPPTAPFVSDANTHILLHGSNASVYDPRARTPYTFVGTSQIVNNLYKHGTGALYFNGTTDYIRLNMNPVIVQSATASFAWEAWVYPTRSNLASYCWTSNFQVLIQANTLIPTLTNTNSTYAAGPALTLNAWNHVAVVRNGTECRVYTNGISGNPYTFTGTFANNTNAIGCSWTTTSFFQGYMDDIRLTIGSPRYVGPVMAPPTSPLTL